jgi:hypothetical protein
VTSLGMVATRIARGAAVQLWQRCPRVKRDGMAGLAGCSGQAAAAGGTTQPASSLLDCGGVAMEMINITAQQ